MPLPTTIPLASDATPAATSAPRRVVVLGGGQSTEHAVSLASAAAVAAALRSRGHTVDELTVLEDGAWATQEGRVDPATAVGLLTAADVAFPVLHGENGEDGSVAGFLRLLGVPFVGSPVGAGAVAMDKRVMKLLAQDLGIAVARGRAVRSEADAQDLQGLDLPVVVKPVAGGSSHGVTVVHDADDFVPAVRAAFAVGDEVLVEEFVVGREIDVAVHRDASGALVVSDALEIVVAPGEVFDSGTKYDGSARFVVPAPLAPDLRDDLVRAASALYEELRCSGVARFDFFASARGLVLNEVNTSPGFSERSQVPLMFATRGTPYPDLVDLLVQAAVQTAAAQAVGQAPAQAAVAPAGGSTALAAVGAEAAR